MILTAFFCSTKSGFIFFSQATPHMAGFLQSLENLENLENLEKHSNFTSVREKSGEKMGIEESQGKVREFYK